MALFTLIVRNTTYFRYSFLVTSHKCLLLVCDLLAKIFLWKKKKKWARVITALREASVKGSIYSASETTTDPWTTQVWTVWVRLNANIFQQQVLQYVLHDPWLVKSSNTGEPGMRADCKLHVDFRCPKRPALAKVSCGLWCANELMDRGSSYLLRWC